MGYKKEQYKIAKSEGRQIIVSKSIKSKLIETDTILDFDLKLDNKYFELVEKTENIIIGKLSISIKRKIAVGMCSDISNDKDLPIPDIYISFPTETDDDYCVQKSGHVFTVLKFPALKGWQWEMYNCANYKANTKNGYAELWFCWRKNK